MKITPIYVQTEMYKKTPSFGSNAAGYAKSITHPELCLNYTAFYRLGYNMQSLVHKINKLQEIYKKPIDLTVCGCSDGTKAIEFQMALIFEQMRNSKGVISLDKLPKIRAFDINGDMINIAKQGIFNISDWEFEQLNKDYGELVSQIFLKYNGDFIKIPDDNIKLFENKLKAEGHPTKLRYSYQYNPEFLEKIEFYEGDIFEELPKLKSDIPQIISCENIATHQDENKQKKLVKILKESLCPGSYVIVGPRDSNKPLVGNIFVSELKNNSFKNDNEISLKDFECVLTKQSEYLPNFWDIKLKK